MHGGPSSFSGADRDWAAQMEERLARLEKAVAPRFMKGAIEHSEEPTPSTSQPTEEPKKLR